MGNTGRAARGRAPKHEEEAREEGWNEPQRSEPRLITHPLPRRRPSARPPVCPSVMTADRRKRHLKILELISTRAIRTQEDLAEALAAEGWEVTQSSVSRDITALRLIKANGVYRRPSPAATPADPDERRIADGVLTIEPAGEALIVLHTPPGEANRVAVALDRLAWPDVVGTIAGDDTIFLAVKDATAQRRVVGEVRKLTSG